MPRRRPTLAAYMRRRWRAIGAIVILLLGSLLVLGVTDRGHDPIWSASAGEIDQAALSPDASTVYALGRSGDVVRRVQAHAGADGSLLWESEVNATRALLAAGPTGVAVATDFPLAFLTFYDQDGRPEWQVPLEGNPVALRVENERVALALNAPQNPVLLFDGGLLIRTYRLPSPVRALDLEQGLLATGGLTGEIVVHSADHRPVLNLTLNMTVRSLALAHDGTSLFVGGASFSPIEARGRVAYLDIGAPRAVRWEQETPVAVGLVDLDAAGLFALAVEEAPPGATLHVWDGATGATRWTRLVRGGFARDDAGTAGGAALSPDGAAVAAVTLRGELVLYDTREGDALWRFEAAGGAVVAFAESDARRLLLAGRLLENRPVDSLLVFSASAEPLVQRAALLAAALAATAAAALALVVGVGYWRARRSY